MKKIEYEIVKQYGVISTGNGEWTKELNLVSWGDNKPKYDIRNWNPDHSRFSKGITLTEEELDILCEISGEVLEALAEEVHL